MRSIPEFCEFITSGAESGDISLLYDEAKNKVFLSRLQSLKLFFYFCYEQWIKRSLSDYASYSYNLLDFNDAHFQYYANRLVTMVDKQRLPPKFEELTVMLRVNFPSWVDKATKLQNQLLEIMMDHNRGEEFIQFMDEHEHDIDINLIWKELIQKSPKNLDAFRRILLCGYEVLKFTNWDKDQRLETPNSMVRSYNKAKLISCVDGYLRNNGDAEWAESAPMKLAKRVAECEAVAFSTLELIKQQCQEKSEGFFDEMMGVLGDVITKQIETQQAYSNDLLSVVFQWQHSKNPYKKSDGEEEKTDGGSDVPSKKQTDWEPPLVTTLRNQGQKLLNLKKIKGNPVGWRFAQRTMVFEDSCIPFFISSGKYGQLIEDLTKSELEANAQDLETSMKECVQKDLDAYTVLCNRDDADNIFGTTQSPFPLRQDDWFKDEPGRINQPAVNAAELEYVSLRSTSPDFDAQVSYDFNSYLNQLLTNAHIIDPGFSREMRKLHEAIEDLRTAELTFGPVKGLTRCKAKAAEEKAARWPKSATLLDLIRCTFCFETVTDLVKGIRAFNKHVCPTRERRKRVLAAIEKDGDDADRDGLLSTMFELVRRKNGFYRKFDPTKLEAPSHYCDVKINLAVRLEVFGKKYGIIGEVQFLLRPMLDNKKIGHKLYEVSRNNEGLFKDARRAFESHFSSPVKIINQSSDNSAMSEFLLHFSHPKKFHNEAVLTRFLKTVTLGTSFKFGLFQRASNAHNGMRKKSKKVKKIKFNDDFLCKLVANRSALPKFDEWLDGITELVGAERLKQLLLSRDPVNGYTPLMAYLSNISKDAKFNKELAISLIPVGMDDEEYVEYWLQKCLDNRERNIVRMCADQCVAGSMEIEECFEFLNEVFKGHIQDLNYFKIQKDEYTRMHRVPMLGMLFDLPKGAKVNREILTSLQRAFGEFEIEEEEESEDEDAEDNYLGWGKSAEKTVPDPSAKEDEGPKMETITPEIFWGVDCVDRDGNTAAHALAYSAAKRGLKKGDALDGVIELCGPKLFQEWLVKKVNSCVPLMVYLGNCETAENFDSGMFEALIPVKKPKDWWSKTCTDESGGNIIHVFCRTAASKQYSPIPALKQMRRILSVDKYDKLLEQTDKSGGFQRGDGMGAAKRGKNPLLEFVSLSKDDLVTKDETLSMLIPQKRRVLYPAPGSDSVDFWKDHQSNFAIYLVESAAKKNISPKESMQSLKKMCSDETYLDLINQESLDGYNALTAYISNCDPTAEGIKDTLFATLIALVPTGHGVKEDSEQWKQYCNESCISTQIGNPLHLCAVKYARDALKDPELLESVRKLFDSSLWDQWLMEKHNDLIPAVCYISQCKRQSDFDIEVFKAFLPKPFRSSEKALKGFKLCKKISDVKASQLQPAAEEEKKEESKEDEMYETITAEEFWLERALGIENRTVLHLCVHTAKEEILDPSKVVIPIEELIPEDILNQMKRMRCKFGSNPMSHWIWWSKTEAELSISRMKLFIPSMMSDEEHMEFFIENCKSKDGRNLIMKLASLCLKIKIPLVRILEKWQDEIGSNTFDVIKNRKTSSGLYTCLVVADIGREEEYEYFLEELRMLLPPVSEMNILDFILQMPRVERVMNKEFFEMIKNHLDSRPGKLNEILMTHTMDVSGNTFLMEYVMNVHAGYQQFDQDTFEFWTPDLSLKSDSDHRTYWMKTNSKGLKVVSLVQMAQEALQKDNPDMTDMVELTKQIMDNTDLWSELEFEAKPDLSEFAEDIRWFKMTEKERTEEQLKETLGLKNVSEARELLEQAKGDVSLAVAIHIAQGTPQEF